MIRRQFIKISGGLAGIIATGISNSAAILDSLVGRFTGEVLHAEDIAFINDLAELILPTTDTPGGKEAEPGQFIALILRDCYSKEDQRMHQISLQKLQEHYQSEYGHSFTACSEKERYTLAERIDLNGDEAFKLYKGLIVSAYLSSEVGLTKFMKYNPVPGRYDGCATERPW